MNIDIANGKLTIDSTELILPGYDILERVGAGANAAVFLVYHKVLDRKEALKVWKPKKHRETVNEEQFYAELRKNALFTGNSSIATIYTGAYQSGIYYCIMEYCPGITLENFLEGNPAWFYRWALARQISDTMKSIYEKQIFHGDLHSKNIIINMDDDENWLKILDLGTSIYSGKRLSQKRDAKLLYELSFQLLPCLKELPFYNDVSIANLPSPLLNKAFRAVINISMPRSVQKNNINNLPPVETYLPPDYHSTGIWEIVSMVKNTPVFSLPLVDVFLCRFGHSRTKFYEELHEQLGLKESLDADNLVESVINEYSRLNSEYIGTYENADWE